MKSISEETFLPLQKLIEDRIKYIADIKSDDLKSANTLDLMFNRNMKLLIAIMKLNNMGANSNLTLESVVKETKIT